MFFWGCWGIKEAGLQSSNLHPKKFASSSFNSKLFFCPEDLFKQTPFPWSARSLTSMTALLATVSLCKACDRFAKDVDLENLQKAFQQTQEAVGSLQ